MAPPPTHAAFRVFSAAGSQPIPWPRSCTSHIPIAAPCKAAISLMCGREGARAAAGGIPHPVPPRLPQIRTHRQRGSAAPQEPALRTIPVVALCMSHLGGVTPQEGCSGTARHCSQGHQRSQSLKARLKAPGRWEYLPQPQTREELCWAWQVPPCPPCAARHGAPGTALGRIHPAPPAGGTAAPWARAGLPSMAKTPAHGWGQPCRHLSLSLLQHSSCPETQCCLLSGGAGVPSPPAGAFRRGLAPWPPRHAGTAPLQPPARASLHRSGPTVGTGMVLCPAMGHGHGARCCPSMPCHPAPPVHPCGTSARTTEPHQHLQPSPARCSAAPWPAHGWGCSARQRQIPLCREARAHCGPAGCSGRKASSPR